MSGELIYNMPTMAKVGDQFIEAKTGKVIMLATLQEGSYKQWFFIYPKDDGTIKDDIDPHSKNLIAERAFPEFNMVTPSTQDSIWVWFDQSKFIQK